tara:strand:- start:3505 stop:4755 length:1251 start_codon:yes stop_codon:yes gene_type:complete
MKKLNLYLVVINKMVDPEPIEPEANDASAASLDAETLEDINKETRDLENKIATASSEEAKSYYADYFKNMLTGDIGTKLLDSLKSIRNKLGMKSSAEDLRSGMEKINKYLEDNTKTSGNFNKTLTDLQETLKSGGKLPIDLTPSEGKAVTEFLQKQGNGLWKELNKADSEIMDDLKKYINDNGGVIKDVKSAEEFIANIETKINELLTEKKLDKITKLLQDNEIKNREKQAEEGKTVSTRTWDSSSVLKLLSVLVVIGEISVALYMIAEYCNDNSGCMYIQKVADPSVSQTSTKTYCVNDKTTWAPSNCGCNHSPPKDPPSIGTDIKVCSDSKTFPDSVKGGKQCINEDTLTPPYAYYNYNILDPISGSVGLGNQVINDIGDWLSKLTPVLKTIGIIILAVLIIYLFVHFLIELRK